MLRQGKQKQNLPGAEFLWGRYVHLGQKMTQNKQNCQCKKYSIKTVKTVNKLFALSSKQWN